MSNTIPIRANRSIADVQHDFTGLYPFLRLDFYKVNNSLKYATAEKAESKTLLRSYGFLNDGELALDDSMTVLELERLFRERFGIYVQVARKSGILWLETTMTDNWTLKQQNDHGRELSEYRTIT